MHTSTHFLQLIESAKDKYRLTDQEVADAIECSRTYISKIRGGKSVSERLTRAAQRLLVSGPSGMKKPGSHPILAYLADQVGVTESEFFERLLKDYGSVLMLKMQAERKSSEATPIPLKPEVQTARASMALAEEKAKTRRIRK